MSRKAEIYATGKKGRGDQIVCRPRSSTNMFLCCAAVSFISGSAPADWPGNSGHDMALTTVWVIIFNTLQQAYRDLVSMYLPLSIGV